MLGAADIHLEALGASQQAADQFEIEFYSRQVKKVLGEAAYQQAWEEGSRMTLRGAVQEALEGNIKE